jgi:hypothetical protein
MLAMVVVAALLSLPGTSSAAKPGEREAEPPATRGSPALWVPGLILLGTSWAVGANVFMFANLYWSGCEELLGEGGHTQKSVLACRDRRVEKTWRTAPVLAPVVGPFIVASAMHDQEDGYTPGMLVIGGTQVIGTALIVAGQLARRPALLEDAAEQSSPSFRSSAAASPGWRSRPASSTSFSMQARGRPQDDLDHVDVGRLLDGDGGGARASLRRSTPRSKRRRAAHALARRGGATAGVRETGAEPARRHAASSKCHRESAVASARRMISSDGTPRFSPSSYNRQAHPAGDSPATSVPSTRIVGDPQRRSGSGVCGAVTSTSSRYGERPVLTRTRRSASRAASTFGHPGNESS